MTFISPQLTETTKQDQVKEAIRSLLGLGLLEGVNKRIQAEQSSVNRRISKQAGSEELANVSKRLQDAKDEHIEVADEIEDLNHQIENLDKKLSTVQRELQRALEAGNYEHLAHQQKTYKKQLEDAKEDDRKLKKRHQQLFENELLSWSMLEPIFHKGYTILDELHKLGEIPARSVPVLKERLTLKKCICGAELVEGSDARNHVISLINQQSDRDADTEQLTSLYYQVVAEFENWHSTEVGWSELVTSLTQDRTDTITRIETANSQLQLVEAKINEIDQVEIESKYQYEKSLQSSVNQKNIDLENCKIRLRTLNDQIRELTDNYTELLRVDQRSQRTRS